MFIKVGTDLYVNPEYLVMGKEEYENALRCSSLFIDGTWVRSDYTLDRISKIILEGGKKPVNRSPREGPLPFQSKFETFIWGSKRCYQFI